MYEIKNYICIYFRNYVYTLIACFLLECSANSNTTTVVFESDVCVHRMNVNFRLLRIAIRSNTNEVKANRLHCTPNEKRIKDCTELHKRNSYLRVEHH